MTDHHERDDVELASAYLDGEATSDERARVEGDAELLALVDRMRRVRNAVSEIAPAPAPGRERAIAAALREFDRSAAETDQPTPPANVVPLDRRRRLSALQGLTAAAAAALVVVGGFVIAGRNDSDDSSVARDAEPTTTATTAFETAGTAAAARRRRACRPCSRPSPPTPPSPARQPTMPASRRGHGGGRRPGGGTGAGGVADDDGTDRRRCRTVSRCSPTRAR